LQTTAAGSTAVSSVQRTATRLCDVVLKKSPNEEGYGFYLAYSNSFMDRHEFAGEHVVHWIEKGGPADIAGLRDGDKIINVSGFLLIVY